MLVIPNVETVRQVKERCQKIISEFRKTNRYDERKSGDAGTFTEIEQLLCEIVEYEDDAKKEINFHKENG